MKNKTMMVPEKQDREKRFMTQKLTTHHSTDYDKSIHLEHTVTAETVYRAENDSKSNLEHTIKEAIIYVELRPNPRKRSNEAFVDKSGLKGF